MCSGEQSACDENYTSEEECAAACVDGGWDWYEWEPLGFCEYDPVGDEWTCGPVPPPPPVYKWQQPPDPAHPQNLYYGWNQFSEWCWGPVVADDWLCTTPEPVTDIHWWGSYIGWKEPYPPSQWPPLTHFHIQVWTDVPAGVSSFSHPGQVIWEVYCYNWTWEFVGWDFDPLTQEYESCFKFTQVLQPWEYFYQPPLGQIYWLSIAACYD